MKEQADNAMMTDHFTVFVYPFEHGLSAWLSDKNHNILILFKRIFYGTHIASGL